MNIAAELQALVREHGWSDRTAFYADDTAITHGELHNLAARVAEKLREYGVQIGSRVVIAMPDDIAWVATFLAVARLGATAVLVNPVMTAENHRYIVDDCAVAMAICDDLLLDCFTTVPRLSGSDLVRAAAGCRPAPTAEVDLDHPLYIQFTSGTTGKPKGVVHRHADLGRYYRGAGAQVLGFGTSDVALSVSKLFFAYGLGNSIAFPLYSGGAAVLNSQLSKSVRIAELVNRYQVTYLFAVPSAYANLVSEFAPPDFRSVRAAVTAGERIPSELWERATDFLDAPVHDQLGSTEAGHAITSNGSSFSRAGTVGRAVPGFEVEIRDETGVPVPDGTSGTLWMRGPTTTLGYVGGTTIPAGSWLNSRDLALRNPDGSVVHLGRIDDLELVGGINVAPTEVEDLLLRHPAVREVVVAAVRNERGATKLRAFVVPNGRVTDPLELESSLISCARAHLEAFKVPRSVEFVEHLPRTATGKIRRSVVRSGSW